MVTLEVSTVLSITLAMLLLMWFSCAKSVLSHFCDLLILIILLISDLLVWALTHVYILHVNVHSENILALFFTVESQLRKSIFYHCP